VVDYSRPAADGVFDGADFEKFLHDRIKVDNKAGQLGDKVKITRDGKLTTLLSLALLTSYTRKQQDYHHRQHTILKALSQISDEKVLEEEHSPRLDSVCSLPCSIRPSLSSSVSVVASAKDVYQLRFYNIAYVPFLLAIYRSHLRYALAAVTRRRRSDIDTALSSIDVCTSTW